MSEQTYLRADSISLLTTAVIVVLVLLGLQYMERRTHVIENLIVVPEPAAIHTPQPSTTP